MSLGSFFWGTSYVEFRNAKKALATGDYQIVEGVVSDFVSMPPDGHSTESFSIGDTSFSYGSGWGSILFNSEWNRGTIHNGVLARIAFKGEKILRVEVK